MTPLCTTPSTNSQDLADSKRINSSIQKKLDGADPVAGAPKIAATMVSELFWPANVLKGDAALQRCDGAKALKFPSDVRLGRLTRLCNRLQGGL